MSPLDIRAARSRFFRALAAALAVAAVVAGSAFAVTKHPTSGKADPWIADSAKQRAALDTALAGMTTQQAPKAWKYKPMTVKKWHKPAPRVIVLAPKVVTVNSSGGSTHAASSSRPKTESSDRHETEGSDHGDTGGDN
jgi:hypothetical protein